MIQLVSCIAQGRIQILWLEIGKFAEGALGRPSRFRFLSGEEPDALISLSCSSCRRLFFKREGGGWPRLNRLFGGELDGVLHQFQREVWAA
jgi:hypothetical protein